MLLIIIMIITTTIIIYKAGLSLSVPIGKYSSLSSCRAPYISTVTGLFAEILCGVTLQSSGL
jgi:hypothetical protein